VNRIPPNQTLDTPPTRGNGALVSCSVWLYFGFVGAAAFGAGLILLLDSQTSGALALGVTILGGTLAPVSWLRAWMIANASLGDPGFASGPEVTRLGRHARDCAELAAWPEVGTPRPSRRH